MVDGVQVKGGIQDIHTDDIASLEIVKGASASALYGSRAGNGEIVIPPKEVNTMPTDTGYHKKRSWIL